MTRIDHKTAIVTGSSRGIGAEVAKILAGEGAAVVVNYRQKAPRANKVVGEIQAAAKKLGVNITSPRITFTTNWGDQNYTFDVAAFTGQIPSVYAKPRTWGVTATYRFGG